MPPPQTAKHVNLPKFMGDWYVISYFPWFAEKGHVNTMDIYKMRPDGRIDVTYAFRKKSLNAPRNEWKARARVFNPKTNAHWKIQFFPPFEGDFLILDVAPDYRYTVIGENSRKLLWIMSRKPTMCEDDYTAILGRLKDQGYDTSKLVKVLQPAG